MTIEPRRDVQLDGNARWELAPADGGWRVESGSLAIFAVERGKGDPSGEQIFLFELGTGDVLVGSGPVADAVTLQAVALEPTGLSPIVIASVDEQHWRGRLEEALGGELPAQADRDTFNAELHRRIAHALRLKRQQVSRRHASRLSVTDQGTQTAVRELGSVLVDESAPEEFGTPLMRAAARVAATSGIALRSTAPSGDRCWRSPVEAIAAASHVRIRRVLLEPGWWQRDSGAILAFAESDDRPLALLPKPRGGYRQVESDGVTINVDARRATELKDDAYVFIRPFPEKVSGSALLRFALRGQSRDLLMLVAGALAATVMGMATPQVTATLVDGAIPAADLTMLWHLGLALVAAAAGATAFRWIQSIATLRVETSADVATQSAVWDRLLNLQVGFFRRFTSGDLLSRVSTVSQMRAYLSGTTLRTLFSGVAGILNLALLFYYSGRLALLALAIGILAALITVIGGASLLRYSRQILERRGEFFGLLVQLIQGIPKLRVAAAEARGFTIWSRAYATLARLELGERQVQDRVALANSSLAVISRVGLFALAAAMITAPAAGGGLTTGTFLAFHVAFGTFLAAISSLSNTITDVMAIGILRERVAPLLREPPEVHPRKSDPGLLQGSIGVDHLRFRYSVDGNWILDGLSLEAHPGEFIALVGPSGSGKSTLLRILLGFESPASGSVRFDGQELAGLDMQAVRRQMGVVLQGGRMNAGSFFDNIAAGSQINLEQAWEAARATGFADDIAAMPMGMHTIVSEGGGNLSGGQRQRLLLTRALVHNPRILLLDEATSALDNRTQAIVTESLARLRVTRVVVAHRLSTIRPADRIYVVDAGRIVQSGSFDTLAVEKDGLFARLMERQLA